MSLTVVLGFSFKFLTMFLLLTADVFLGLPIGYLLLSTPVVSLFFRAFQMVVLARANVCAMALIYFPPTLRFTIACFSLIDSSLVFMLVKILTMNAVCTV